MFHDAPKVEHAASFPTRTIGFGLAAMIVLLLLSTFLTWRVGDRIRFVMDAEVDVLTSAQKVDHYGTVLEMSIKSVVAYGDSAAAAQYRALQPQLRTTLTNLRNQVESDQNRIAVAEVDRIDLELVAMEYEALDLVGRGQFAEARRLINSDKYDHLVDIYVQGIRGIEKRAEKYVDLTRAELNFYMWLIVGLSAASLLLVILGWIAMIRPTRRWGDEFDRARAAAEFVAHQLQEKHVELEVLNRKLFDQARIDPLTGLHTRLKFNEDTQKLWPLVEQGAVTVCAMMCDFDFFKQYNDTRGHLEGDRVLRKVAQALKGAARSGDLLYRFGGEEFLVVISCRAEEAAARGEQYRAAVEALDISHPASPLGKVTMSVGMSCVGPDRRLSLSAWLTEADEAMYEAKASGRNSVVSHTLAPSDPEQSAAP